MVVFHNPCFLSGGKICTLALLGAKKNTKRQTSASYFVATLVAVRLNYKSVTKSCVFTDQEHAGSIYKKTLLYSSRITYLIASFIYLCE